MKKNCMEKKEKISSTNKEQLWKLRVERVDSKYWEREANRVRERWREKNVLTFEKIQGQFIDSGVCCVFFFFLFFFFVRFKCFIFLLYRTPHLQLYVLTHTHTHTHLIGALILKYTNTLACAEIFLFFLSFSTLCRWSWQKSHQPQWGGKNSRFFFLFLLNFSQFFFFCSTKRFFSYIEKKVLLERNKEKKKN